MTRHADQPAGLPTQDEPFLRRWSHRKLAARSGVAEPAPSAIEPSATASASSPATHTASVQQASAQHPLSEPDPAAVQPAPLPAIESLTFDSDFRAFLQPHVAEDLKRQALKKLLHDPRFNVMDGLDVYIDDYSVPSPLEPALARSLAQARYIFEPPQTRVNAAGYVEDVAEADALRDGRGETEEPENEQRTAENHIAEDRASENDAIADAAAENHAIAEPATENQTTPPASAGQADASP